MAAAAAGGESNPGGAGEAADPDDLPGAGGTGAALGPTGGAGGATDAGSGNSSTGGVGDSAGSGSGSLAGAGGAPPEPPHITSSQAVGALTEEDFKARCDARGGTVEVMPHCGGFATAKGFSYDVNTELVSEHTCAGANTCGGWNCVIVD